MEQFANTKELRIELAKALPFPAYDKKDCWDDVLEAAINSLTTDDKECRKIWMQNPFVIEKLAAKTLPLAEAKDLAEHWYQTTVREALYTLCYDSGMYYRKLYDVWKEGNCA